MSVSETHDSSFVFMFTLNKFGFGVLQLFSHALINNGVLLLLLIVIATEQKQRLCDDSDRITPGQPATSTSSVI